MVIDHTSQIGHPPRICEILVVSAIRGDIVGARVLDSKTATNVRNDNNYAGLKEEDRAKKAYRGEADFISLANALEFRIELNCSLEMFFRQLVHSEIL
jgi:hypothetical protein